LAGHGRGCLERLSPAYRGHQKRQLAHDYSLVHDVRTACWRARLGFDPSGTATVR
jgi:hypothetical protein